MISFTLPESNSTRVGIKRHLIWRSGEKTEVNLGCFTAALYMPAIK